MNAILDMKWSHQDPTVHAPILAVADARSKILLYTLYKPHDTEHHQLKVLNEFQSEDESILNLSLDWGNRVDKQLSEQLLMRGWVFISNEVNSKYLK